jgi:hypothetical protein
MNPLDIVKSALKTTWSSKALWFFGFFVAAAGGAGAARSTQGTHAVESALPAWVLSLIGTAVVLAVVGLVLHVICDGALIDSVRRARGSEPVTIAIGFRTGARSFWRLLRVKLLAFALLMGAALPVPVLAFVSLIERFGLRPMTLAAPLALVLAPVWISIWLIGVYATRISVLEAKGAVQSFREARAFLSGRLRDSLQLMLLAFAGQIGGAVATGLALLPGAAVGAVIYFILAARLVPALIAGCVLALPLASVVAGAVGAFQSAIWTTAYLEGRIEEAR